MTQPTILTANFAPISLSSMGLTLVEKYGPASERTWHFSVRNQGTGGLFDVKWFFLLLLQRTGTPCTPVLLDRPSFIFDLKYLGDIPPGGAIPMKVRVNTSNCEPMATFSFTAGFYRNGITTSGVAHGLVLSVY